jgi:FkbM family methyltransferase
MFLVSPLIDFAVRLGGPRLQHRVYLSRLERWRTYEPEYYLLDHLVDPSRAAIDVGGNEGLYAGRMSQLCKQVHCFEPIPWFAEALRRKLEANVTVHQCALSNRQGQAELRIPYRGDVEMHGTSTLEQDNPLPGSTHVKQVPCKLERLDDVIREPVGFIKIDVEGHELAVLEGAGRILAEHRPVLLIESEKRHHAGAPEVIFQHLARFGYDGFFLLGGRLTGLSAFRADEHQPAENAMQRGKLYANNFIFIPGGKGG